MNYESTAQVGQMHPSPYRHWGPDYLIFMMNNPSNNRPSQANEEVKVSQQNRRQGDTEEKNELQLITVRDVRDVSGAGCGPLSFLLSLSATVGDLKGMLLLQCWWCSG